jgi:hypothetical protein
MQQTYNINSQLLESALKITGISNYDEVINLALKKFLQIERQKKILELEGKIQWEGDLEQMRSTRGSDDFS